MAASSLNFVQNTFSDLSELIFKLPVLDLDMFVLSFQCFADLNFDQFDLNFGLII